MLLLCFFTRNWICESVSYYIKLSEQSLNLVRNFCLLILFQHCVYVSAIAKRWLNAFDLWVVPK